MVDKSKKYSFYIFFSLLIISIFSVSCERSKFSGSTNNLLEFSADTLNFGTVFSTIKSSTQKIIVSNPHKKPIKISRLFLEKENNSGFQINVDGENTEKNIFNEIEILAKDSIYIFVALNPNNEPSDSPTPIADFIVFDVSEMKLKIRLEAIAQNTELLKAKIILNDTTLNAQKPYIIYDSLVVPAGKKLELQAGCRLYFHNKARLSVHGSIEANGTLESPIEMRGDRFDNVNFTHPLPYDFISGQWDGIYLFGDKQKHVFKNVIINSANVGIYSKNEKNVLPDELPEVLISNCRIHNFLFNGLVLVNTNATVVNSEISNTGASSVYLRGGKHDFVHTTIANYFNSGYSSQPKARDFNESAVILEHSEKDAAMKTTFINSVIMGDREDELQIEKHSTGSFEASFRDSYIKRSDTLSTEYFKNIRWMRSNDEEIFRNTSLEHEVDKKEYYNFEPGIKSPIRGIARSSVLDSIPFLSYDLKFDLKGKNRTNNGKPDAGAYQWVP